MQIRGLQKLTLLDFPERLACTVFLGGCNFRCPFCHNASLVMRPSECEEISEEELFSFLEGRRGKLAGVCITGGEPTLYPTLPTFISKIRALGFAIKLDTNGTNPEMLASLIDSGMLDYVAMDIKSSREAYATVAGVPTLDIQKIEESVQILLSGRVDYEFRTTVVKPYHSVEDIRKIGQWIKGAKKYFLQSFVDSGDLISDEVSGFSEPEMQKMLDAARENVPEASLRGV